MSIPYRVLFFVAILIVSVIGAPVAVIGVAADANPSENDCTYPITVTDATGTNVTVEEPPDEIVVLHASAAQVVHDIDKWDAVTGAPVTPFTAYLEDHDVPKDVTDEQGFPIVESIVDLDPDLVLAGHVGDPDTIEALRGEGLTVYQGPTPTDVDDIRTKVRTYGTLVDACSAADERIDWMDETLAAIEEDVDVDEERPLVYYELGDGWTAGEGTFQHDLIERAGGENLGAAAGVEGWGAVDEEVIVDLNPDFVIYGDTMDEPPVTDAVRNIPAIEQDRTVAVDSNLFSQAGPRVVLVIEMLAEEFTAGPIEEPVDDVDDTTDDAEVTDDHEDSVVSDDDGDVHITTGEEDDDTAEALPGFGAIAGVIALLAAVFARRDP